MPREARQLSESGFYHVMFRGINHQNIFEEEPDYAYMKGILRALKVELGFKLYAYCLMTNHVHILLAEREPGDISVIFKRLLIKYVMKFNKKYQRTGALIESRYKSKPVEVDEYFIPLIVYIHQNPLRAGLVKQVSDYRYSSYKDYMAGSDFIETELAMNLVSREHWRQIHQQALGKQFEIDGRIKLPADEIYQKIKLLANGLEPIKIGELKREERNRLLKSLKNKGLSVREIERATGISRGIVAKS